MNADRLLAAVQRWVEEKRTGHLILNFKDGHLKDFEHHHREFLPQEPEAPSGRPCPVCGEPMEEADYGNLFRCKCGTKRTRSQLKGR